MQPLPIDALLPEVRDRLRSCPNLVVEAPPGAGKTTRLPPAILDLIPGKILVLEPRRIAARLAARRVAAERGEPLGETVGYQVRFEETGGPRTRLWYLTEGVLTRRLLSDPALEGAGAVVLDEFHERHLEADLALALLRRLQSARPDLRLVVMSATLEAAPLARYLGGCPVLRSEGKLHAVQVDYLPVSSDPLERQAAGAVERLVREGLDGDVLVFLPGAGEIRRAGRECEGIAKRAGLLLTPLHGSLSLEEQDRAVRPAGRRKVILSTNVAESSITVEGVTAVIDSGLARIAAHSPWSGLPVLEAGRIARSSADQRAGRAGRLRPGRVLRLYPQEDYRRRPAQQTPEIQRVELSQLVLQLAAMGIGPADLPWLDPPPPEHLESAGRLLERLKALDASGRLAALGRRMIRLPLHPRLARLAAEAEDRGAGREGAAAAALLSAGERLPAAPHIEGDSDLFVLLDSEWSGAARRTFQQLCRMMGRGGRRPRGHDASIDEALQLAVLAAFPDRVARRRKSAGTVKSHKKAAGEPAAELLLANGGGAKLSPASTVRNCELLVAVEAEERREQGLPVVRLASGVRAEWLLDLFPERIEERSGLEWNRAAERVEAVSALLYDGLVIEESRSGRADPRAAAALLAEKALEAGLDRFIDRAGLDAFLGRLDFAAEHAALPRLGEAEVEAAFRRLCEGLRSFAELRSLARSGALVRALEEKLPPGGPQRLDEVAPARIRLPGGRRAKVNYEPGKPPWAASRLQDFFGMRETPRVARGEVPVVLHLLAPNRRPVQMTQDLESFWKRLYPEIRRQLSRRYPKHAWPEDPLRGSAS